jgi:hypothetical protein
MLSLYGVLMVIGVAAGIALPLQLAAAQAPEPTRVTDSDALRSMGFAPDADNVYMGNQVGRVTAPSADAVAASQLPLQLAAAQAPEPTRVTDPDALRSMGFAPDADNVYMGNWVGRVTAPSADAVAAPQAPALHQSTPTTGVDFSAISAKEFIGRIDTTGTQWTYDGGPNCCVDLSRVGSELFADAQFEVPTGATLNFFRFWAFDNSPSDLAFFVFSVCQPAFSAGPPVITTIVSTATSGTPGHTSDLAFLNQAVDNQSCTYLARVRFDAASRDLALQKVRLQFTR